MKKLITHIIAAICLMASSVSIAEASEPADSVMPIKVVFQLKRSPACAVKSLRYNGALWVAYSKAAFVECSLERSHSVSDGNNCFVAAKELQSMCESFK
ncbi:hypothetical protein [Vibrio barjaei]|uniref:hypothetical protein n=1 Tax=Vibrio barjaei TaxID=1676683 RepID=UPI0022842A81|nr:hypothetical protein [Vibrio barjaei]MCY9874043.1 hypothetical protein [Vibrio barjaei]